MVSRFVARFTTSKMACSVWRKRLCRDSAGSGPVQTISTDSCWRWLCSLWAAVTSATAAAWAPRLAARRCQSSRKSAVMSRKSGVGRHCRMACRAEDGFKWPCWATASATASVTEWGKRPASRAAAAPISRCSRFIGLLEER